MALDISDVELLKEAIYNFLSTNDSTLQKATVYDALDLSRGDRHPNLGVFYIFEGALGEFWVTDRGNVLTANAPPRMTVGQAEKFVRSFLENNIEDFSARNYQQVDSELDDYLWREEWQEFPGVGEVSVFENWITVQVNLEKRDIHYYNASDLRQVRSELPDIDEQYARQLMRRRYPDSEIQDLHLMEHTTDGGQSWMTIWDARLVSVEDPDAPANLCSINADTGEIVP